MAGLHRRCLTGVRARAILALSVAPLALMATSPPAPSPHTSATTTTTPLSMSVFGSAQPRVGFDGDAIRIQAETTPPPPEPALSLARVWFGDGTSVTLPPPPCHKTLVRLPSPGSLGTLAVAHVYESPGQKEVQIGPASAVGPTSRSSTQPNLSTCTPKLPRPPDIGPLARRGSCRAQ